MKTIFRLTAAFVFLQMIIMRTVGAEETDAVEVKSVRKPVALPGLIVNFEKRCVDLEARVCLDAGYLELIACTQGTKEHESIVSVSSKALHIHTALLLLGADSGHPEMRKLVDEKTERWVNLAPRGDPVEVMLVLGSNEGKMVEKPISDSYSTEKPTGRSGWSVPVHLMEKKTGKWMEMLLNCRRLSLLVHYAMLVQVRSSIWRI